MRRVLVIVLILLFPLNVFALSMSASLLQDEAVTEQLEPSASALADAKPGKTLSCAPFCDLDPDEPPGSPDLHDIVNHEASPRLAGLPGGGAPPRDARRHCHSPPPPVKPPRA
ncbi:hypothetical protein [Massilia consociata]|uniref:Uncharacterized protein n=1 Tax=Massilia consociata TaxID=760117 RepID=A0ABV6FJJ7_9BURK